MKDERWSKIIDLVLGDKTKLKLSKVDKKATKLALSNEKLSKGKKKEDIVEELHALLSSNKIPNFNLKGGKVRRIGSQGGKGVPREAAVALRDDTTTTMRKTSSKRKHADNENHKPHTNTENVLGEGPNLKLDEKVMSPHKKPKTKNTKRDDNNDANDDASGKSASLILSSLPDHDVVIRNNNDNNKDKDIRLNTNKPKTPATTHNNNNRNNGHQNFDNDVEDTAWRASLKRTDVKSGPFSTSEKETIKSRVAQFAQERNFSTVDYSWIFTGRGNREGPVKGLWKFVAAGLPQRTIKSVAAAGNRMFHPDAHKGKWTAEEDEDLRGEVEYHGHKWSDIGIRLGRTREACRLRWSEIRLGDRRTRGAWAEEEEERLKQAVSQYLEAKQAAEKTVPSFVPPKSSNTIANKGGNKTSNVGTHTHMNNQVDMIDINVGGDDNDNNVDGGNSGRDDRRRVLDDIDWGVISSKVGTRSNIQCLEKWYSQLAPSMVERGAWGRGDDRRLLRALWASHCSAEYEVTWDGLVQGRTAQQTKRRWRLMAKTVPNSRELEFVEILEFLVDKHMPALKSEVENDHRQ